MFDALIQQLNDPDPAVRKRTILALGKSKNLAAVKPLAAIVRGDPVPELRDLALKAGQYIRHHAAQQTRPSLPHVSPFKDFIEDDPEEGEYFHALSEDLLLGEIEVESKPEPFVIDAPSTAELAPIDVPKPPFTPEEPPLPRTALKSLFALDEDPIPLQPLPASKPLYPVEDAPPAADAPAPFSIVRGRQFNIPKEDQARAKDYLNAAMSLSMNGDDARALKNLTSALGLNPNLINDGFFNNVATVVTGLEGDAAAQVIIDRTERKRFTQSAAQAQKDRRVEQHLTTAEEATWGDVWFEVILYSLIVIIGPVFASLVVVEMWRNLITNSPDAIAQLPEQLQNVQTLSAALSISSLLPIGIISGISGVISLLLQTVLIHFSAKLFGGNGTWRHLIRLLLGFYNVWLPRLFLLLYVTTAVAFVSLLSPIVLCFVLVLVVLTFYVSSKTASKIGEAYDFGTGKGCLSMLVSLVVVGLLNAGVSYLLAQTLGLTLSGITLG